MLDRARAREKESERAREREREREGEGDQERARERERDLDHRASGVDCSCHASGTQNIKADLREKSNKEEEIIKIMAPERRTS